MDRFAYACEKDPYTKSLTGNLMNNLIKKDVHTQTYEESLLMKHAFYQLSLIKTKFIL